MTCRTSSSSEALARPRAALDRRGFTLLELMLVMAVMSLALGLGLPRIGAVRTAYLAGEEAREVAAFVRAARMDAVASRTTVGLTNAPSRADALEQRRLPVQAWTTTEAAAPVTEARDHLGIWDAAVVHRVTVSGAIRLETDGQGILFFANGSSSGGEILLYTPDGRLRHHFRVDPATGAIVAQRGEES
jgi:prepilin-type N-terminal cleavage/methylation domain-containing protein